MKGSRSLTREPNQAESSGQFNASWLWVVVLLIAAGLATQRSVLFAVAACLLTVVPFAWLWKRLSLRNVEYERTFDKSRAFPGETISMQVRLTNRKVLPLSWIETTDEIPTALPLVHGQLEPTHDPKVGLSS